MTKPERKRYVEIYKDKKIFSEEDLLYIFNNFKGSHIPLKKIPYHLLTDVNIIKKLFKHGIYTPDLIKVLPDSIKSKNIELMKSMITGFSYGYQGFKYLPVKLRKDKRFVLDVLEIFIEDESSSGWVYGDIHKDLRNDKDVALMAMRSGGDSRDLPNKFKENKSMVLACLEFTNSKNYRSSHYHLEGFKFNKIKITKNFANLLMQSDPLNYEYLDTKHKNKKEWAISCIKKDIYRYEHLPKRLRLNTEIMEYVFSRNPSLSCHLPAKDILKKDFSKLNLGKKEREIIYSHCEEGLKNQAGIFELAQAKKIIFKPCTASFKVNSSDLDHCNKNKVLKKLDKLKNKKPFFYVNPFKSFYNNISFELKKDKDILLKLVEYGMDGRVLRAFNPEKNTELQINKQLFIKRRYGQLELPEKNNKVREYMISKICANEIYNLKNSSYSHGTSFNYDLLKDKEKQEVIEDSFHNINLFHIRTKLKLVKHLSRAQITKMIINDLQIFENIEYHDYAYKIFGYDFKKNVEFAKRIFLGWPKKSLLKVLDLDYLMKNNSFTNFLKNVNQITIHEDDFLQLPGSLKRNKVFIEKVLAYNFELYEHLSSALKTDKEITDWIFTIAPRLAKSLALNDFEKIDTSDLHPSSRKIIYRQYLRKRPDDIFEKALMKRKLLHIKDFKKAS